MQKTHALITFAIVSQLAYSGNCTSLYNNSTVAVCAKTKKVCHVSEIEIREESKVSSHNTNSTSQKSRPAKLDLPQIVRQQSTLDNSPPNKEIHTPRTSRYLTELQIKKANKIFFDTPRNSHR